MSTQRLQIRRGSAASARTNNATLLDGEMALTNDTHAFKVGDGVTQWNNLPPALASAKAALRGNRVVFLGDSIMSAQSNDPRGTVSWGLSGPAWATYLSKGRVVRAAQAGVPGDTAAMMLARFDTDVTPYRPAAVVIMAGTNDWKDVNATTLASYITTMRRLVGKCREIGAQPVILTVPPHPLSTTCTQRTIIGNQWLRAYCAGSAPDGAGGYATEGAGIPLGDAYNTFVDPATGDWLAAYGSATNDKTHPIGPGYPVLGQLIWDTLSPVVPVVPQLLPMDAVDPYNLLTNGLNLTTTGSGTSLMPTGWSVNTGAHQSGTTGSLVTGDATIKGNWWKVTADGTSSTTNSETQLISTGIVGGHVYAHVGRFKATGMRNADTGSGSTFLLGANFNSLVSTAGYDWRVCSTHAYDVAEGTYYHEITAPSDATSLLIRRQLLNATAGAGTLQVAQQGVYDLTALGLTT